MNNPGKIIAECFPEKWCSTEKVCTTRMLTSVDMGEGCYYKVRFFLPSSQKPSNAHHCQTLGLLISSPVIVPPKVLPLSVLAPMC